MGGRPQCSFKQTELGIDVGIVKPAPAFAPPPSHLREQKLMRKTLLNQGVPMQTETGTTSRVEIRITSVKRTRHATSGDDQKRGVVADVDHHGNHRAHPPVPSVLLPREPGIRACVHVQQTFARFFCLPGALEFALEKSDLLTDDKSTLFWRLEPELVRVGQGGSDVADRDVRRLALEERRCGLYRNGSRSVPIRVELKDKNRRTFEYADASTFSRAGTLSAIDPDEPARTYSQNHQ